MPAPKQNMRRYIRVKPDADAPIRIDLIGADYIEVTYATDISLNGVGINVPHGFTGYNLSNLARLMVQLPEPTSHSFTATARVTHQQHTLFGAEFDLIGREDYLQVHRYIANRLKSSGWLARIRHHTQSYSHQHQVD